MVSGLPGVEKASVPPGWKVGVAACEVTRAMTESNLWLSHDVLIDAVNDSEEARQTWLAPGGSR